VATTTAPHRHRVLRCRDEPRDPLLPTRAGRGAPGRATARPRDATPGAACRPLQGAGGSSGGRRQMAGAVPVRLRASGGAEVLGAVVNGRLPVGRRRCVASVGGRPLEPGGFRAGRDRDLELPPGAGAPRCGDPQSANSPARGPDAAQLDPGHDSGAHAIRPRSSLECRGARGRPRGCSQTRSRLSSDASQDAGAAGGAWSARHGDSQTPAAGKVRWTTTREPARDPPPPTACSRRATGAGTPMAREGEREGRDANRPRLPAGAHCHRGGWLSLSLGPGGLAPRPARPEPSHRKGMACSASYVGRRRHAAPSGSRRDRPATAAF
jgi:hypothetical protein